MSCHRRIEALKVCKWSFVSLLAEDSKTENCGVGIQYLHILKVMLRDYNTDQHLPIIHLKGIKQLTWKMPRENFFGESGQYIVLLRSPSHSLGRRLGRDSSSFQGK